MTRKRVKLAWIMNDHARKACFRKRSASLLKKVTELTTLCDVTAFAVIYSPDDNDVPAMWPSLPEVEQMLERFLALPEAERIRKGMDQQTYLRERIEKANDKTSKVQMTNMEAEVAQIMHQVYQGKSLDELSLHELYGLSWLLEEKKKAIRTRISYIQHFPVPSVGHLAPPSFPSLPPIPPPPLPPAVVCQGPVVDVMPNLPATGDGRTTLPLIDTMVWDQYKSNIDMMNNIENRGAPNSSIRTEIGNVSMSLHDAYGGRAGSSNVARDDMGWQPRQAYAGSSSNITDEMVLSPQPHHLNFGAHHVVTNADQMGLHDIGFRPPHGDGGPTDMGL